MIEGACARSPRQFVICYAEDGGEENGKSRKHSRGVFPRGEKIINAFIDSIKMKDYCIAPRSFAHVTMGKRALGKDERLCMIVHLQDKKEMS